MNVELKKLPTMIDTEEADYDAKSRGLYSLKSDQ